MRDAHARELVADDPEHPVTELVTGLDLVEQQLRVASGEPLALGQDDVVLRGHAIEVRVCAEDPSVGFLPAIGQVIGYHEPAGPGIRVDSGVELGSSITPDYDSLLAKVIAYGHDREEALERLTRALQDLRLLGVTTNAGFLARLIVDPQVRSGDMDTMLIERGGVSLEAAAVETREAAIATAAIETLALHDRAVSGDAWDVLVGWRVDGPAVLDWDLERAGSREVVTVLIDGAPDRARVAVDEDSWPLDVRPTVRVELDGRTRLWTTPSRRSPLGPTRSRRPARGGGGRRLW